MAVIFASLSFFGFIDKSALFPSTSPNESNIIDLPAPVSPVRTQRPSLNSISISSINIIFLIYNDLSILIKNQNFQNQRFLNQLHFFFGFFLID